VNYEELLSSVVWVCVCLCVTLCVRARVTVRYVCACVNE